MSTIQKDHVVTIHYILRDDDGDVIDASEAGEPMIYLHGHENIVPGLEKQLEGKKVGDKLTAVVEPEDGYGEPSVAELEPLPREAFPEDIEAGMQFMVEDDDGDLCPVWIVEFDDEVVHVDLDHPLAGVRLHFEVEIVEIRPATKEELAHGHVHGEHGHEH
ncbi:MAG: peptidylprolyl isomerase [Myxococcales bacterium]|nr:peptidylprolyl isomerase [Myxococcales bacterium]MCA9515636.1 peptidylprolyl isomerase [Myxococcales bacterium]MCB9737311.1 peptidylprolyl isomerase [Deltaproteobacteria bacterium]